MGYFQTTAVEDEVKQPFLDKKMLLWPLQKLGRHTISPRVYN